MTHSFERAQEFLKPAADELFDSDPKIQSVGIGRYDSAYAYHVVRNIEGVSPLASGAAALKTTHGIPVKYDDVQGSVETMGLRIPASDLTNGGNPVDQQPHRPLLCGLQIQNFDDDQRCNILPKHLTVGTLGVFVKRSDGAKALLSNNHVMAGENDGQCGGNGQPDRIMQHGATRYSNRFKVAELSEFKKLTTGYNEIDAAVASVIDGIDIDQTFHHSWTRSNVNPPQSLADVTPLNLGERVFKVGRTTGLTYGEIDATDVIVGPIPYPRIGGCRFRNCFHVKSTSNQPFCARGDSGSALIKAGTGEIVGLLFAGTKNSGCYACSIKTIFAELNLSLA